ncbi:YbaB/EbfC family nucleoid-associated protein [Actinoplanes sp. NPDC051513]|uniref:YbaB/EbfC family nucleoid-associated protein n=1 Tax=Actinoplanes sp. NPDC051513 TaxID=3363908 RepID=UPI00378EFD48
MTFLDPDAADTYLQGWKARIDRMAADTKAMSDRLADLRVTASDDDGLVEVTIDSTGVLLDVRFHQRIQRAAPEAVSRALMSALRAARLKAADHTREIITETVGSESVAARTIAERVERQLLGASTDV